VTGGGVPVGVAQPVMQAQPVAQARPRQAEAAGLPATFAEVVSLFVDKREPVLAAALSGAVHLVRYEPGQIEFRPESTAPADLAPRLSRLLGEWTGRPWLVSLSREAGAPTLREQHLERELKRKQDAANHPLVQAVLAAFPGATIEAVRDLVTETPADDMAEAEVATGEDE
jgi:DNA polymerase-3 subunit gamma/tau